MKFVGDFEDFLAAAVDLNQTRLDRLDTSVKAIEDYLLSTETFGAGFTELIPAGSWAHRTIIRPVGVNDAFDADVLLPVTYRRDWQPKDYIEQLYTTFQSHGTYQALAHRMKRCVRIEYAGEVHIDVVPYVDLSGTHVITNRTHPDGMGQFERSNPEAFTVWVDDRQRWAHGYFIKTVRLVKYLRDFKGTFTCKSIILKTLLGNQLTAADEADESGAFADVPSTLVTLMERLAAALPEQMPQIFDPGGTGEDFTQRYRGTGNAWDYKNFRMRIADYAERMRAAYDDADRDSSTKQWRSIFGDTFMAGITRKAVTTYTATMPWSGEQQIDQPPFSYALHLDARYRAHVAGRMVGWASNGKIRKSGFGPYDLSTRGNRVQKGMQLQFSVTTNVPQPYQVFWKVRNGGDEAATAKALRGEISRDGGANTKQEHTLYKGRHYVECYIVKDGLVVARDRQPVNIV